MLKVSLTWALSARVDDNVVFGVRVEVGGREVMAVQHQEGLAKLGA